jgi:hypothetical protein
MRRRDETMDNEKKEVRAAFKAIKEFPPNGLSGGDRAIIQMMIYHQLKHIADVLENREVKP